MNEDGCICASEIPPGGFHESDCPLNPRNDETPDELPVSTSRPGIPRHRVREACRHLATKDITRSQLARKFGVSPSAITQFARRNKALIDEIRNNLDDEYAGLWIAKKTNRVAALQADFDATAEHPKSGHHEWVKARTAIVHAVAEELGQLPARAGVMIFPVTHVVVGVDLDECFPDAPGEEEQEERDVT